MRSISLIAVLFCLSACPKSEPREMTEDEKWSAALAAGPTDPVSLKEFVVVPLAAALAAPDQPAVRPEVSFYAPLPEGWARVTTEAPIVDEKFVSRDGNAHVDFKVLSGNPEQLANARAKAYADLGFDVDPVNVSADGTAAEFTFVNRLAFDLAYPEKPPVYGRVTMRMPAGWPLLSVLSAEGRWLESHTDDDYGDVWNVMEGVVTQ